MKLLYKDCVIQQGISSCNSLLGKLSKSNQSTFNRCRAPWLMCGVIPCVKDPKSCKEFSFYHFLLNEKIDQDGMAFIGWISCMKNYHIIYEYINTKILLMNLFIPLHMSLMLTQVGLCLVIPTMSSLVRKSLEEITWITLSQVILDILFKRKFYKILVTMGMVSLGLITNKGL